MASFVLFLFVVFSYFLLLLSVFYFLHSCGSLNIYHHYANGRAVSVAYNFLTLLLLCFWLWRHRLFCVFVLLMLGYRLFTCLQLSYNWCASRVTELEHGITIDIFSLFSINRKKTDATIQCEIEAYQQESRLCFLFLNLPLTLRCVCNMLTKSSIMKQNSNINENLANQPENVIRSSFSLSLSGFLFFVSFEVSAQRIQEKIKSQSRMALLKCRCGCVYAECAVCRTLRNRCESESKPKWTKRLNDKYTLDTSDRF